MYSQTIPLMRRLIKNFNARTKKYINQHNATMFINELFLPIATINNVFQ
jgi:hypothetical protein